MMLTLSSAQWGGRTIASQGRRLCRAAEGTLRSQRRRTWCQQHCCYLISCVPRGRWPHFSEPHILTCEMNMETTIRSPV